MNSQLQKQHDLICREYRDKGKSTEELLALLAASGISITKATFDKYIQRSGIRKNQKSTSWRWADHRIARRSKEGKETDLYVRGRLVPETRRKKEIGRYVTPLEQAHRDINSPPATPEGWSIETPNAMDEDEGTEEETTPSPHHTPSFSSPISIPAHGQPEHAPQPPVLPSISQPGQLELDDTTDPYAASSTHVQVEAPAEGLSERRWMDMAEARTAGFSEPRAYSPDEPRTRDLLDLTSLAEILAFFKILGHLLPDCFDKLPSYLELAWMVLIEDIWDWCFDHDTESCKSQDAITMLRLSYRGNAVQLRRLYPQPDPMVACACAYIASSHGDVAVLKYLYVAHVPEAIQGYVSAEGHLLSCLDWLNIKGISCLYRAAVRKHPRAVAYLLEREVFIDWQCHRLVADKIAGRAGSRDYEEVLKLLHAAKARPRRQFWPRRGESNSSYNIIDGK
ncbi:hypothetical protein GGR56DRAFT_607511 [Xylariaceae sp. FL0804]|nr:hypothetical protein GGR56DRAFT_607511 [Xylariaceae sp. FL0804]